jgi:limonene-1,2-epoxide hydrolase
MLDDSENFPRRGLLAGTAFAALATFARSGQTQAQGTSTAEAANRQLVADFCAAWSTLNLQNVVALMSNESVYRMTEDTPPVTGHQALIDQMQPWVDTSSAIEFRILDTFPRGPLVVNHRIDSFSSDTRTLTWEGVGVFLIEDGRIREWFDYTIRVERG